MNIAMTSQQTAPLQVLLISDGRPGHYNLSEGIIAAIARRRTLDVKRLEVRKPTWIPGAALSALTNARLPADRILKTVYAVDHGQLGRPDLIVSAGGNTLAANIAAARMTKAPNIFYGSLRRFRPSDFALVMTSYQADANAPNRLMWLKPSSLDPDASAAVEPADHGDGPAPLGLIVGGDSGTIRYAERDWSQLIAFVCASHERTGIKWILANSPRTPDAVSARLSALSASENSPLAQFIDVRSAGPGTLGPLLAQSQAIVCTADSSTMLSEAVWMRQQVVAVEPRDFQLPANEQSYRDWLTANGWLRQLPISALEDPGAMAHAMQQVEPQQANPLDKLAAELQRRLPELFIG